MLERNSETRAPALILLLWFAVWSWWEFELCSKPSCRGNIWLFILCKSSSSSSWWIGGYEIFFEVGCPSPNPLLPFRLDALEWSRFVLSGVTSWWNGDSWKLRVTLSWIWGSQLPRNRQCHLCWAYLSTECDRLADSDSENHIHPLIMILCYFRASCRCAVSCFTGNLNPFRCFLIAWHLFLHLHMHIDTYMHLFTSSSQAQK